MVKFSSFIIPMLAIALLFGCCQVNPAQSRNAKLPRSMKGYELYSWELRGEWHFALLVGTNRLKTRSEINSPKIRVRGIKALKKKLSRLAAGEEVFWSAGMVSGTVVPPERIVEEVKNYCKRYGITVRVSERGVSDAPDNAFDRNANSEAFIENLNRFEIVFASG